MSSVGKNLTDAGGSLLNKTGEVAKIVGGAGYLLGNNSGEIVRKIRQQHHVCSNLDSMRPVGFFPSGMRFFGMYFQLFFFLKCHLAMFAFEDLVFLILLE
jgi:hypothetical protein